MYIVLKRLIDILLSLFGIIFFLPLIVVVGLLIKIDSKGPVFYLTDRVGKDLKKFKMIKFRTMIETTFCVGQSVCPQFDPRVTRFGSFLRRTKINEIPQLINILKGEMTFVGPRPEAPDLAELYPEEAQRVFTFKPGLVGPATILMRNEEELYPTGVDAKEYYIKNILPKKIKIDLAYLKKPNLFKEFSIILIAFKETMLGSLKKKYLHSNRTQIYLLIADTLIISYSYIITVFLFTKKISDGLDYSGLLTMLPAVILIILSFNIYFGVYTCLIRYISYHEILGVIKGVTSASLFLFILILISGLYFYLSNIVILNWVILTLALSALRIVLKKWWKKRNPIIEINTKKRVLIFGANESGIFAFRSINLNGNSSFEVVGFIDDATNKFRKNIYGVKVLGNRFHIKDLVTLYKIEGIIFVKTGSDFIIPKEILNTCQNLGLKYWIFNIFGDNDDIGEKPFLIRNIGLKDLLPTEILNFNYSSLKRIFADKAILLNGTGGSLGHELSVQILKLGCKKLIVIDRYESYLSEFLSSFGKAYDDTFFIPIVGDIEKDEVLKEVFENHHPEIVFQMSMRKFPTFFKTNIDDFAKTNYVRTFNLAKFASKYNSDLFVMVSSLSASQNGSMINDSLRIAEVSLEQYFKGTNTRLVIPRICDIIENRGGAVTLLENQLKEDRTLTLPSIDSQICLISKFGAAKFVLQSLLETFNKDENNKIFNCKPSFTGTYREFAETMLNLHGLKIDFDIPIIYTDRNYQHLNLSPSAVKSTDSKDLPSSNMAYTEADITSNKIESIFKNFVLSSGKETKQDWEIRTKELIKLCGQKTY